MANFFVHATTAFAISVTASAYISAYNDLPLQWGGILCCLGFLGGLLPDIDSNETKIARYASLFLGFFLSLLLVENFFGIKSYAIYVLFVCFSIPLTKAIDYGLKKWTVHRGVFHSIPMTFLLSIIVYSLSDLLLFPSHFSLFCAFFLGGGYFLHLTLDEIWSLRHGVRSTSFGKAWQIFRYGYWKSFSLTYLLLAVSIYFTPNARVWVGENIKNFSFPRNFQAVQINR